MSEPAAPVSIDITTANFESALINASLTRPMLVLFWTPRSEASITLGSTLEKLAGEYQGSLGMARIEVDTQAQIAAMFGVRGIPTVVLMRDGQPVDGFAGNLPEAEIRDLLGRHLPAPEPVAATEAEAAPESPADAVTRLHKELAEHPDREALRLDLAVALMQTGDAKGAAAELDALPANLESDDRAKRVRGQLELAEVLKDAPSAGELEARLTRNAEDHEARDLLGVRLLVAGQTEAALEHFLGILASDRHWNDGLARKRLITAFLGIDDADLVGRYRRRMSSLLF